MLASSAVTRTPTATDQPSFLSTVYPNLWFSSVPEPIRFITAANLGNIAFFKIDQALYNLVILPLSKDMPKLFQRNRETVSFFLAYLIQVGLQHFLNALMVYGLETIETSDKYFQSLALTYSSYSFSLVGSTVGNALLIGQGVPKNVAFWSTIIGFGVINFFLLKFMVGGSSSSSSSNNNNSSRNGKEEQVLAQGKQKSKVTATPKRKRSVMKVRGGAMQQQQQRCHSQPQPQFQFGFRLGRRIPALGRNLFGRVDPWLAIVQSAGNSVEHIE